MGHNVRQKVNSFTAFAPGYVAVLWWGQFGDISWHALSPIILIDQQGQLPPLSLPVPVAFRVGPPRRDALDLPLDMRWIEHEVFSTRIGPGLGAHEVSPLFEMSRSNVEYCDHIISNTSPRHGW